MNMLYAAQNVSVDLATSPGLLARWLPGTHVPVNILDNISLHIGSGEIVGLVGESGSGKTTLARTMLGLQAISGGELRFKENPLANHADFSNLRRNSALMFQDPVASLSPRLKIGALITEPYVIHGIAMTDWRKVAVDLLDRVGLQAGIAERYPHELSGGQARRVCVARALALNPQLVIADEPTAGLDVSVQGEILNLMTSLKLHSGISFLVITHNLAMVRHVTDRVAILYLGRLVETGPTRKVFSAPAHPYTRSLIASEPQPDPRKRRADLELKGEIPSVLARPSGCAFHTRCALAVPRCITENPQEQQFAPEHSVLCHRAGELQTKNTGG